MFEAGEDYRYDSAGAGDLSSVSVPVLALRLRRFKTTHERQVKFNVELAGAKLK